MFNVSDKVLQLSKQAEEDLKEIFNNVDDLCFKNSSKVLNSFIDNRISEIHFNSTSGYGYNDIGRDKIEDVFSQVLGAEDSLVRNQFISGSHALTVCLFALLRPNDVLLSISGKPYDTLDEVIGIVENKSSLQSYGVKYEQIELVNDDFDYNAIEERVKKGNIKLIEIQRSRGYSTRKTIDLEKVEKVIKLIKDIDKNVIIMIDNCYCEFVTKKEPIEVGADVVVGSLIKNLGGGIAPNGGYIAGKKDIVELAAERLTAPGIGKEIGPSLEQNTAFIKGLFFAPSVVASSVKTAVFASRILEKLGYEIDPLYNEKRGDIVQTIKLKSKEKLIKFCQGIQSGSPIDANVIPEPSPMGGYDDEVIMAAGTFTEGSTIELSCDGPIREPYIAYMQGGLTYEYGKLGILKAISNI